MESRARRRRPPARSASTRSTNRTTPTTGWPHSRALRRVRRASTSPQCCGVARQSASMTCAQRLAARAGRPPSHASHAAGVIEPAARSRPLPEPRHIPGPTRQVSALRAAAAEPQASWGAHAAHPRAARDGDTHLNSLRQHPHDFVSEPCPRRRPPASPTETARSRCPSPAFTMGRCGCSRCAISSFTMRRSPRCEAPARDQGSRASRLSALPSARSAVLRSRTHAARCSGGRSDRGPPI